MKLKYDAISPITGNLKVLVEAHSDDVTMAMCMESGYQTYSTWKEGSDDLKAFEGSSPPIILDSKFVEDDGQVWYKTAIFTGNTVLYPDKVSGVEVWKVGRFKKFQEGDAIRFNWATMQDDRGTYILDDENSQVFPVRSFEDAMFEFHAQCSNDANNE